MKPRLRPLFAAGLLATLTAAFAATPVITTAFFRDFRSLDPVDAIGSPDRQVMMNIFAGLVRFLPGSSEVEPHLAESWSISDDGLTYTFVLRAGLTWQGGYGPLTAHDVAYTVARHLDPESGSRYRSAWSVVERVDVIDDLTVTITLKVPFAPFLAVVLAEPAGLIMNRRAVEDAAGDDFRPIGAGPYRLVSYTPRETLVLEAFDDYFLGAPEVRRVTVNIVPDETVQALAMQRGDLNYLIVRDVEVAAQLRAASNVTLTETPATGFYSIAFNTERISDVRVRRAIAHAVDKDLYVEAILEGQGSVVESVIVPGMFGAATDLPTYPYDVARARALLAEVGGVGAFEFIFIGDNSFHANLASVTERWLADVGVRVTLRPLDTAGFDAALVSGDFDLTVLSPTRVDADQILVEHFRSDAIPPNGSNRSRYAAIDDLVDAQRAAADDVGRAALLREAQIRIAQDVPVIPIYAPIYASAQASYLTGDLPNTSHWHIDFARLRFLDLNACVPCR